MSRNRKKQRTTEQKLRDYEVIARMVLQGKTQREIGEALGLTQQQISLDLKAIKAQWIANTQDALIEHLARELAKLDLLELECWAAWERSQGAQTKTRQHFRTRPNGELVPYAVIRETTQSPGDPVYLERLQSVMEKRWQLLGLLGPDAPQVAIFMQQNNVNIAPEVIIDDPNIQRALELFRQDILDRMYDQQNEGDVPATQG